MANRNPGIPKGVSPEERKALEHRGGHGEGHEGPAGQGKGDYNLPKHRPFKPDHGYTGQGKGVGDNLRRK